MKKEKIKQLVDVMQAYVNGKTIQYYKVDLSFKIEHPGKPNFNGKWVDVDEGHHFRPDCYDYRIKPKPKYRPFKDADECWQGMLTHQPFGWLREKKRNVRTQIGFMHTEGIQGTSGGSSNYKAFFDCFSFADGAPFGVKEEVWEN
mgnify:FL=1|jgi:hypothetical protein